MSYPAAGEQILTDDGVLCNWVPFCMWCGQDWEAHDHATGACPGRNGWARGLVFRVRGWAAFGRIA